MARSYRRTIIGKVQTENKIMIRIWLVPVLIVAPVVSACGQYNETIRSRRPGIAIGPFTVGKGVFQIQTGVDYFTTNDRSSNYRMTGD